MKIIIDKDLCIGCGTCAAIASKSFKMGEDGKAELIDLPVGKTGPVGDDQKTIQEAIDSCPVTAIKSAEKEE